MQQISHIAIIHWMIYGRSFVYICIGNCENELKATYTHTQTLFHTKRSRNGVISNTCHYQISQTNEHTLSLTHLALFYNAKCAFYMLYFLPIRLFAPLLTFSYSPNRSFAFRHSNLPSILCDSRASQKKSYKFTPFVMAISYNAYARIFYVFSFLGDPSLATKRSLSVLLDGRIGKRIL